ncbi:LANO_0H14796g1_1 [Lachancea nothofagi CBS 11611]|uniref:LANO_0H14796g1_1 n=1 Tax=Lachancea nothofagi CBS 11611 TaxID=1266666 RepID=A0A1G4KMK0_9SACH|nr:LANO_0H14796g1_1 [Lachancea nothofagi CBS 11611]
MASYKKRHPSLYLLKTNSSVQFMPSQDFELQPQSEGSQTAGELAPDVERMPNSPSLSFKFHSKRLIVLPLAIVLSWLIVGLSVWQFQSGRVSFSKPTEPDRELAPNRTFSMSNILDGDFSYYDVPFSFISQGGLYQIQDTDPGLYLTVDDSNGTPKYVARQLVDRRFYEDLGGMEFKYRKQEFKVSKLEVSHRLDFAIITSDREKEYRHSSQAYYWLKDIKKSIITPIKPFADDDDLYKLSYARFSPSRNFLYFVYNHNLYIRNVFSKNAMQISFDGSEHISNGKPDWVYEEEVLATDQAVWWAHDDSKLVWARFDDSKVQEETLPIYINDKSYDDFEKISYPKPGTPNPEFSLFSYNVMTGALHVIPQAEENDRILYHAQWLGSNYFMFKDSDRASQIMDVKILDMATFFVSTVRTIDATSYSGWIEKSRDVKVIPAKDSTERKELGYVDVQVDDKGFSHLFYFPTVFSQSGHQLTSGPWEVTGKGIIGYDYGTDAILFLCNSQNRFSQHLFLVPISTNPDGNIQTLQDPKEKDSFYDFEVSLSCRFGVKRYLGPKEPMSDAGDLTSLLQNDQSRAITQLTRNTKMLDDLERYDLPFASQKSLTLDDGVEIDYIETLPFNMASKSKHPLLVHVYGGPGSQTVDSKFAMSLEESLASSEGAVILKIEPRGTGGRGWNYRSFAKGQLGYWEPRDVIATVKEYIKLHAEYVDTERVAIWGWSYGGFVTLKTLELDGGDVFKYGVAVAPVTDWRYYNSIYTERYMGLYESNEDSYLENAVVENVSRFSTVNRFLLMHGSADDNVHLKNMMRLLDKLNLNNVKNYDMNIFPDSEHSIVFHNAGKLIYEKIYYWLKNAFEGNFDHLE